MDINASTLRSVYTGLSTAFNTQFNTTETTYGIVAMTVPSVTAMNEYPRLDDLPGMREWIGDRVVHDLSAQTYIIRNREFEKTIGIKRSQIEDDQIGLFTPVASQFGMEAAKFPDELVWPLFAQGNTEICYDGQYFFDTDHPGFDANGDAASVSNFTAGAGPAWYLVDDSNVMKPMVYQTRKPFKLTAMDKPDDVNVFNRGKFEYGIDGRCNAGFGLWQLAHMSKATLNAANYKAAREKMMTIRKRDGRILSVRPKKLLVPPSLESEARTLLNAELIDGGNSNVWKNSAELVVIPDLA